MKVRAREDIEGLLTFRAGCRVIIMFESYDCFERSFYGSIDMVEVHVT